MLPLVGSTIVPPGLELSFPLRCLDHLACDPILDRAARIEIFDLGQDQRLRSTGDPRASLSSGV